jgi:hypothetical protein
VQPGQPVDLAELGSRAFGAWLDGTLARENTKREILADIYSYYLNGRRPLPHTPESAEDLLQYREFLAEAVREIVQEALFRHREADPERYRRQTAARLTPRPRISKGLVSAVRKTLEALHTGAIDREEALARLRRQLRGFDLSVPETEERVLSAEPTLLHEVLTSLEPAAAEANEGDEQKRILLDLVGSDLAAMQRELFGGDGAPAKVEYRRAQGGPELVLEMVVTKRRAHAPIGFCEGVCTAPDEQLWERPEFMQVIFWGPGRQAWGGMHLLVVEEEGTEYLTLPGINPSMKLLQDIEADAFLDAALDFAQNLCAAWKLEGVWLPENLTILSNRGPIQQAIRNRDLPSRRTVPHQFSYSPYAYSFDSVLCVEAASVPIEPSERPPAHS